MPGLTHLGDLLAGLAPALHPDEMVFATVPGRLTDYADWDPLASFREDEGLTLVLPRHRAEAEGLGFDGVFRQITLTVHSSLDAVGLTAAVASRLNDHGIPANVVAAFHHDHVFVPAHRADDALQALEALSAERWRRRQR